MSSRTDSGPPIAVLLRTGPFHQALRAAIERSGLTLESLRRRLSQRGIQVSIASLSYWQQGRSRPERVASLRAVRAIEGILGLPAHSLIGLLGPPRPRGRWTRQQPDRRKYAAVLEPVHVVAQTIESVVGHSDHKLRVLCQEDLVTVGANRTIESVRTLLVVQAIADDPDRHLVGYCAESGSNAEKIVPSARENCRLGRISRHSQAAATAVELLFDRRLLAGETHLLAYAFDIESPVPSHHYRRAFRYPVDRYVVGVRFAEPALPVRCFGLSQREPQTGPEIDGELVLTPGRWIHRIAQDVPAGTLGVGWDWD